MSCLKQKPAPSASHSLEICHEKSHPLRNVSSWQGCSVPRPSSLYLLLRDAPRLRPAINPLSIKAHTYTLDVVQLEAEILCLLLEKSETCQELILEKTIKLNVQIFKALSRYR